MITTRYERPHGIQPASLAAALAMSVAMVGGLVLSSPAAKTAITKTLIGFAVPIEPPPPPDPLPRTAPAPHQRTIPQPAPQPAPRPIVVAPTTADPVPQQFLPPVPGAGDEGLSWASTETILPPPAAPVLRDAAIDPRFARDFQPAYPTGERRAEREGKVIVRVLIGSDGRVRRIERLAAASDAFWAATERQALAAWRFVPATRDGVPVDAWRTMTVRFEMGD